MPVNSQPLYYLDHAAATPLDGRVLEAMMPYFSDKFFNPSSPYSPAIEVRREYEAAKHTIAMAIGAKPDEIVITAGATESINLMISNVSGHIISTAIEHHAVLEALATRDVTMVAVKPNGVVDANEIYHAITPTTQLVTVALANNELGTIQPIRDIAEHVRNERKKRLEQGNKTPIYLHCDASQGVGQIDVNVARLGVDAITINAGKIYGPKQVALLWTASHVVLSPQIVGGGQERGLRSGTENVAGVVGFAKAIELATAHRKSESVRLAQLRDTLQSNLIDAFPSAVISGSVKKRLPGHLHISFPGVDAERLIFGLEREGVMVATGSACAANKGTRSHVLTAIGLAPEIADGSLRITLGRLTNAEVIDVVSDILVKVINKEIIRKAS
jgi:cysteine desulfurase